MNTSNGSSPADRFCPLLVVVEGLYDVGFIKHISAILHQSDPAIPDLNTLETERRVAVVSLGGGGSSSWSHRFAGLGLMEFHLLDREIPPETDNRRAAAIATNCRPYCRAVLTNRRGMENYLDATLIHETLGVEVSFGPDDDVATVVARRIFELGHPIVRWEGLVPSAKKRLRERVKRLLNTRFLSRMTIADIDRNGGADDFRRWFGIIAEMLG